MKRFPIRLALAACCLLSCLSFQPVDQYSYQVLEVLPHNTTSYTQGFFFYDGFFYESTGQYGRSLLAKVDIKSGQMVRSVALDKTFFGEGACIHNGIIYQLTWKEQTCFVYDAETFMKLGTLHYPHEGWGITSDGSSLIMSDGTAKLHFLNPDTLNKERTITVRQNGKEVHYLNELEYVEGEIWANVYTSDLIMRINPQDGKVVGVIDLTNILPKALRLPNTDVLNGIAYDPIFKSVWITGKNWPKVYRIQIN